MCGQATHGSPQQTKALHAVLTNNAKLKMGNRNNIDQTLSLILSEGKRKHSTETGVKKMTLIIR